PPPLGYAPDGRSLLIVEEHAAIIRRIFDRYLVLGNVTHLAAELACERIALPVRQRGNGNGPIGGGWFQRGQLYKILSNPIYIGRIPHGKTSHAGLHPAIIAAEVWEATQSKLADNRQGSSTRVRAASPSLLAGRIIDADGNPLASSHATKQGRRYRYYVTSLPQGVTAPISRVPALEIEAAVTSRIAAAFDDPFALAGAAGLTLTAHNTAALAARAEETAAALRKRNRTVTQALVGMVRLHPARIDIELATDAIAQALQLDPASDASGTIILAAEVTLTRTGRAMRLVQDNGLTIQRNANPALIRLLLRARRWWTILKQGKLDITALAEAEGVMPAYITRVVRLAFLSPAVIEAVLKGSVRAEVNSTTITATDAIPACWQVQARKMLPAVPVS
uniref:recombinase family protein n=1 Tax=Sphingomonas bacterium TaxID=1895847 RepID=UPI0015750A29